MKQQISIASITFLILITFPLQTRSQDTNYLPQQTYFGFDSIEWKRISGRYERSQARAEVQLKDGSEKNGQIISIENDKMIVYPGYDVVIDPDLEDAFITINLDEVSKIKVKRNTKNYEAMIMLGIVGGATGFVGGAMALWTDATLLTISPFFLGGAAAGGFIGKTIQQFPRRYNLNNAQKDREQTINALEDWALFKDTIRYYKAFRDLVDHSALVARSFPVKKLKFTAALGPVGNRVGFSSNIDDAIGSEYSLNIFDGNVGTPAYTLSTAYNVKDKFHIGAALFKRNIGGSYRVDLSDTLFYDISPRTIKGYQLFAEYTPITPDRYLASRFEVICGAGIVFARSEQYVSWHVHRNFTDYYDRGEMMIGEKKLKGLSGHVLANYYVSPNTSLFAGIEGKLFQNLTIPALNELDLEYGAPLDFQAPEYTINYSTIHLKFGINFHL